MLFCPTKISGFFTGKTVRRVERTQLQVESFSTPANKIKLIYSFQNDSLCEVIP